MRQWDCSVEGKLTNQIKENFQISLQHGKFLKKVPHAKKQRGYSMI